MHFLRQPQQLLIGNETETADFASALAQEILDSEQQVIIYLRGQLGAGKTTFSRYLIQAMGHQGNVKSPTYSLMETYELSSGLIIHMDLYRIADPEEIEFLGLADLLPEAKLCLIEWPSKAAAAIPAATVSINIGLGEQPEQRTVEIHL